MFRQLIGSEAGSPDSFSLPFPGAEVSLDSPKQLFILSPSHIAVPPMAHMELTTSISSKIPFIALATVTFPVPTFTRASIATFVNSAGLIEVALADTPRFDHDPVTLAPKGLLLEEARTNLLTRSNNIENATTWARSGVVVDTMISRFPFFSSDINAYLMTGSGINGSKCMTRPFMASTTKRTLSVFFTEGHKRLCTNIWRGRPQFIYQF
jgi:hypothetical protein